MTPLRGPHYPLLITHYGFSDRLTMKQAIILIVAAALMVAPAMASEPAKKPAKKTKSVAPVDPASLDKRVADAKVVFVGEATRIYFVDRRYQEVPYIRAEGEGATRSAMVAVKVVKVLRSANTNVPERVLVPIETTKDIFGEGKSPYDTLVEQRVGKQGVWFGEIVVRRDYGDDKSGRRQLEEPVTLLQSGDPKRRTAVSPLPIEQLKDVEAAIARVKSGKTVVAAEPSAEKP